MRRLHYFKGLRAKILAGYLLIVVAFLVPAAYSVRTELGVEHSSGRIKTEISEEMNRVNACLDLLEQFRRRLSASITELDESLLNEARADASRLEEAIRSQGTDSDLGDPTERLMLFTEYSGDGLDLAQNVIDGGFLRGISERIDTINEKAEALRVTFQQDRQKLTTLLLARLHGIHEESGRSARLMILMFLGVFAGGTFGGLLLAGRISANVRGVVDRMDAVSQGGADLTARLEIHTGDEMEELAHSFNRFVGGLRTIIQKIMGTASGAHDATGRIRAETDRLSTGAERDAGLAADAQESMAKISGTVGAISARTQDLSASVEQNSRAMKEAELTVADVSQRIENLFGISEETLQLARSVALVTGDTSEKSTQQDERMQDVVASVERIAGSISAVAEDVERADGIARENAATGVEGGESASRVRDSMRRLIDVMRSTAESVRRFDGRIREIDEVIHTINEISDQTTVLALNAAIVAAQAGEYGRGFSVVAHNVRLLSLKSLSATRDISAMITSVQDEAREAVERAESTLKEAEQSEQLSLKAVGALEKMEEGGHKLAGLLARMTQATQTQLGHASEVTQTVEGLFRISKEVRNSMMRQGETSRAIEAAAEDVRDVAADVSAAVRQLMASSAESAKAMQFMACATQEIATALHVQDEETRSVTEAAETLRELSKDNLSSVRDIGVSLSQLAQQEEELRRMVARFIV